MEMLDRLVYKFFGWIDNQFKKVEDIEKLKDKVRANGNGHG